MKARAYLACYRGRRFLDLLVRAVTFGAYSHCEIALVDSDERFWCYSSSWRDGGVRCKLMPLSRRRWDLYPLPKNTAANTLRLYRQSLGAPYDWLGVLGLIFGNRDAHRRWFCSEWCAAALNLPRPAELSPGDLAHLVKSLYVTDASD